MKKIYFILIFIILFSLASCNNNDGVSKNNENKEKTETITRSVILTKYNYTDYLGFSYDVNVFGPIYGDYGYDCLIIVEMYSLHTKYEFKNVEIKFNKNASTSFKLSSNGNCKFNLDDYTMTAAQFPIIKIEEISGTVVWEEIKE